MNERNWFRIGGAAAFGLALVALPASPARAQKPEDSTVARLQQKIDELQAKLQAQLESQQVQEAELAVRDALKESAQAIVQENQDPGQIEVLRRVASDVRNILIGGDGSGWLGAGAHEVTAENAKELTLAAERGVVLGRLAPASPAG